MLDVVERPVLLEPDGEYQLVTAKRNRGGIEPRARLKGSQIKVRSQFLIQEGDFLISRRQIVHGACGVVPSELGGAIVSNEYNVLRPKHSLLVDYLELLSHTSYFQRTCFHSSVGVDIEKMVFRLENWLGFSFPLPPLAEQDKIVTILASIAETIGKTEVVIDRLRLLLKVMMQELLTMGLPSWPKALVDTDLGRIPADWSIRQLLDCGTLLSGGTPSKQNMKFWSGPIPWVSPKDMKTSRISDSIDHVSEVSIDNGTKLVPAKTILMVVRGMILAHSFPVALTLSSVAFNQDIKALIPNDEFDAEFLLYWLISQKERVLSWSSSSSHGTRTIPTEALTNLSVPQPCLTEQNQLAAVLHSVEVAIEANQIELRTLVDLKRALASALLTGQLRVTSNEAPS